MRICFASPCSLNLLHHRLPALAEAPETLKFSTLAQLVDCLLDRGHQVDIVTCSPSISKPYIVSSDLLSVNIIPWRQKGWKRALDQFKAEQDEISAAIGRSTCGIVHAHWTYEFALAALRDNRPTIITAHDNPWKVLWWHRHPYRLARLVMAQRVALKATCMTGVSPYVEQHWRQWMGFRGHFEIVPNGLPSNHFAEIAKSISHLTPPVMMATLNGWDRLKNSMTLIESFSLVKKHIPLAHLILYGKGHGPGEPAEAFAKKMGCLDSVSCRGQKPYEEIQRALRKEATLFIHPSREESFGLAVAEAMAVGLPIIGGLGCGAIPWTLNYGKAGLLTNVQSPKNLAESIIDLATNSNMANSYAQRALAYSKENFSINKITDKYEKLYLKLQSEQ